jgi:hypothetical protein
MFPMARKSVLFVLVVSAVLLSSSILFVPSEAATAAPATLTTHPFTDQNTLAAGYGVSSSNGSVTGVYVSFTIPKITCSATNPSSQGVGFIAGIDGLASSDFENVGVAEYCQQGPNSPQYYAISSGFYTSIEGVVPVHPGDVIYASITVSGGTFRYYFEDVTTGMSARDNSSSTGAALNFAECGVISFGLPLSKFTPTSFGRAFTSVPNTCDATISGATHPIGGFGGKTTLHKLVLIDSTTSDILATPSALSGGGSSFTVTWKDAS